MAKNEGMKIPFKSPDHIRVDLLEVFKLIDKENAPQQLISTTTNEFSAVCPFSGLPDVAELTIAYFPSEVEPVAVELKSLKYYTTSFRDVGMYQEDVTNRIYSDLKKLLKTPRIQVTTTYNVRGGFVTVCVVGSL